MRMMLVSLMLILLAVAEGMARAFVTDVLAEPLAPTKIITPFDCKRYDARYQTVRCVCIAAGVDEKPYFCNWSTPADRWGGPRKDNGK